MKREYKRLTVSFVPRFNKFCVIQYPEVLAEADTFEEAMKIKDELQVAGGQAEELDKTFPTNKCEACERYDQEKMRQRNGLYCMTSCEDYKDE